MRKICVINQKGGVGKTTTTVNIGAGLAASGKKVLLIDLDPQGNISHSLQVNPEKDAYNLLIENAHWKECIVNVSKNLDVMPGRETLTKAEIILAGEQFRETVLKRRLADIRGYDYIIIDCPPSLGLLNQNAMLFCSEAFVPVSSDVLGLVGLRKMKNAITVMQKVFEHPIKITKVIPTMYDQRTRVCKEALMQMQNDYYEVVSNPIRINSKVKEAPGEKKPLLEYAKSSRGAKDYAELVRFVLYEESRYDVPVSEDGIADDVSQFGEILA